MAERQLILRLQPRSAAARAGQSRPQRVVKDVLGIPKSAVFQQGGRDWCFLLGDHGIEQRPIVVGSCDGTNIEVREGLRATDPVLLYPELVLPPPSGPAPRR